ncbi:MAG: lipopolysaccharide biosynthesis protein, partial [Hyphomicrobium denitrificans]|nr:lipopolysaccharide biosynthesis protein [Hyphomicrobium denitrificans]
MTTATVQPVDVDAATVTRTETEQAGAFAAGRARVSSVLTQAVNVLAARGERERTQRDALVAFAVRVLSAGLLYLTQIVL